MEKGTNDLVVGKWSIIMRTDTAISGFRLSISAVLNLVLRAETAPSFRPRGGDGVSAEKRKQNELGRFRSAEIEVSA